MPAITAHVDQQCASAHMAAVRRHYALGVFTEQEGRPGEECCFRATVGCGFSVCFDFAVPQDGELLD